MCNIGRNYIALVLLMPILAKRPNDKKKPNNIKGVKNGELAK